METDYITKLKAMSRDELAAELHREYGKLCRKICNGYTHSDQDAGDDITQEVFLKSIDRLPSTDFRNQSKAVFKAWIVRVTHRHCLSWCRKRERQEIPLNAPADDCTAATSTIESAMSAHGPPVDVCVEAADAFERLARTLADSITPGETWALPYFILVSQTELLTVRELGRALGYREDAGLASYTRTASSTAFNIKNRLKRGRI